MTDQHVLGMDDGCHLYSSLVSIIQMWWLGKTILTQWYATQADWVTESNTSLWRFEHSRCDWLNHTTWFHSNWAYPKTWNLRQYCFIFLHNTTIQTPICYLGCLMIANTWTYISLYIRNTAILENKNIVCIFLHQRVNTYDLHLHTL